MKKTDKNIKNKRILKNGAIGGYVYYANENKWKWRIIGNNKTKTKHKGGHKGGYNYDRLILHNIDDLDIDDLNIMLYPLSAENQHILNVEQRTDLILNYIDNARTMTDQHTELNTMTFYFPTSLNNTSEIYYRNFLLSLNELHDFNHVSGRSDTLRRALELQNNDDTQVNFIVNWSLFNRIQDRHNRARIQERHNEDRLILRNIDNIGINDLNIILFPLSEENPPRLDVAERTNRIEEYIDNARTITNEDTALNTMTFYFPVDINNTSEIYYRNFLISLNRLHNLNNRSMRSNTLTTALGLQNNNNEPASFIVAWSLFNRIQERHNRQQRNFIM